MSQEMIITLSIVALIALVVGFFIGRNIGGSADSNTQQAVADKQKELDEYKAQVSEHFGKTADLVDNLTQSYKDVFDHLGSSAKGLLSEAQVKQHLSSRAAKAVTLTYVADEALASDNAMQAAQAEIQSQAVVDEATEDAEKMAAEISHSDEQASPATKATAPNDDTVVAQANEKARKTQATLDKAAAAVKAASEAKTS